MQEFNQNNDEKKDVSIVDIKNEQGAIIQKLSYDKNGVLNGIAKTFSPETGMLIQEMQFKNGLLNGEMLLYNASGIITAKITYVDGKLNGTSKFFNESNGQLKISVEYENNLMHGNLKCYDDAGNLIETTEYSQGKKSGKTINYGENGEIIKIANFQNDVLEGDLIIFYPQNNKNSDLKIMSSEAYSNGLKNGTSKKFYENGNMKEFAVYSKGVLLGKIKKFDSDGNEIN